MELARPNPSVADTLARLSAFVSRTLHSLWRSRRKRRTLCVRETAPLGDRRFVAVVEFERRRFLIGASPSAITLLAQLPDPIPTPAERPMEETLNAGERG